MSITHLYPDVVAMLEWPLAERQKKINEMKWISYARAHRIMQKMHDLLHHPPCYRMPNLLIVGDTGNGKTHIIKRFADANKSYTREEDGQFIMPVILLQTPIDADERTFYHYLLDITETPFRPADRVDRKQRQVINTLRSIETRLLIIDEIQHILAGNQTKQRQFLNVLKYLSNELMLPLVGAGIGTAFNAIRHDEQLASRFEAIGLPRWKMGEEYQRLLLTFERLLPLKRASNLADEKIADKLLTMSRGSLGELAKILQEAAIQAIHTKEEHISLSLLGKLERSMNTEVSTYERIMSYDL